MLNFSEIVRVSKKALAWNTKPTEDSFPELPEVLVSEGGREGGSRRYDTIRNNDRDAYRDR
eukprot:scaffold11323_cov209-Amphora_coffeaeformis.AAC.1